MPIDSGNLALKGLDDLFSTEENRQEEQREQVQQIPMPTKLPFKSWAVSSISSRQSCTPMRSTVP